MSKIAITNQSNRISFDGVNIIEFEKGEKFEGHKAETLVSYGFADYKGNSSPNNNNDDDITAKLEAAQNKLEVAEAEAEKAAEAAKNASSRKKAKAEKKAAEAAEAVEAAKAELEKLLG